MADRPTVASVDDYIAGFPPATQEVLRDLRALIADSTPGATEGISYGMPVFDLDGRHLLWFAGYAKHVGLYPVSAGVASEIGDEVDRYRHDKATLRFPLGEPMPSDLIRRVVELKVAERARRT
jgi:uncharacterized protein YdhG (YjbR/CyaY superfamily)